MSTRMRSRASAPPPTSAMRAISTVMGCRIAKPTRCMVRPSHSRHGRMLVKGETRPGSWELAYASDVPMADKAGRGGMETGHLFHHTGALSGRPRRERTPILGVFSQFPDPDGV